AASPPSRRTTSRSEWSDTACPQVGGGSGLWWCRAEGHRANCPMGLALSSVGDPRRRGAVRERRLSPSGPAGQRNGASPTDATGHGRGVLVPHPTQASACDLPVCFTFIVGGRGWIGTSFFDRANPQQNPPRL